MKNSFFRFKILSVACLLFAISLSSCEDDPILEIDDDEECIGSYCTLAVPGEGTIAIAEITNPKVY